MKEEKDFLEGKRILAVDDEEDVLETIEDLIMQAKVDTARDYETASLKIKETKYDLAILDIMGVDGLTLLEEAVERGIPAVMLTAHAVNPETLIASIRKGAISYLPKEKLAELDRILNELLAHCEKGEPPWKLLFERLGEYFDERFGPDWKARHKEFWSEFDRAYVVGKGAQARLMKDERFRSRGI